MAIQTAANLDFNLNHTEKIGFVASIDSLIASLTRNINCGFMRMYTLFQFEFFEIVSRFT